jgi:hypothetical protein
MTAGASILSALVMESPFLAGLAEGSIALVPISDLEAASYPGHLLGFVGRRSIARVGGGMIQRALGGSAASMRVGPHPCLRTSRDAVPTSAQPRLQG